MLLRRCHCSPSRRRLIQTIRFGNACTPIRQPDDLPAKASQPPRVVSLHCINEDRADVQSSLAQPFSSSRSIGARARSAAGLAPGRLDLQNRQVSATAGHISPGRSEVSATGTHSSGFPLNLWRQREFIALLVKRDLKIRYKRSVLGFLWTLLNPLATIVIFSLVFSNIFSAFYKDYKLYMV